MGNYVTVPEVIVRYGGKEISELVTPDDRPTIDPELFRQVADGVDVATLVSGLEMQAAITEAVAKVTSAIQRAESIVDTYVGSGGYSTPVSPVPAIISDITLELVRYDLGEGRESEVVAARRNNAVEFLKVIADGTVSLDATGESVAAIETGADSDQIFTDARLNAFFVP